MLCIHVYASSIFVLRTLKSHGLRPPLLHQVARATTVASRLYASPAWWGLQSLRTNLRWRRSWEDWGGVATCRCHEI